MSNSAIPTADPGSPKARSPIDPVRSSKFLEGRDLVDDGRHLIECASLATNSLGKGEREPLAAVLYAAVQKLEEARDIFNKACDTPVDGEGRNCTTKTARAASPPDAQLCDLVRQVEDLERERAPYARMNLTEHEKTIADSLWYKGMDLRERIQTIRPTSLKGLCAKARVAQIAFETGMGPEGSGACSFAELARVVLADLQTLANGSTEQ